MRLRIVVADEAVARFYDLERRTELLPGRGVLRVAVNLTDPAAHLHDRDFKSDRPGRVYDHAAAPNGRRGATGHHATGSEHRPREIEAQAFARRIASRLQDDYTRGAPDHVVLIAPPRFLGLLRQALPESISKLVTEEIHKDLVREPPDALQAHLAALLCPQPQ
ncbi:MAG TPA: host attachment protein [Steroidobacteraceae bacterium]|nr:host attachment protein [Steroidobacteraceae bacterium]